MAEPMSEPLIPPPGLDLIVFDWDGTLMDSTAAIAESIRSAAADLRLTIPTREQAAHVIGMGLAAALRHCVPDLPRDRYAEFGERYRVHHQSRDPDLIPFDGVVAMLEALSQGPVPLAIATGKSRSGLERALDAIRWRHHFAGTRCADDGLAKPDPWMLRDLMGELGARPERTVMIGDTTHDLAMARAAGTRAIAVTYGAHPRAALLQEPTIAMVDSASQLHDELNRLLGASR